MNFKLARRSNDTNGVSSKNWRRFDTMFIYFYFASILTPVTRLTQMLVVFIFWFTQKWNSISKVRTPKKNENGKYRKFSSKRKIIAAILLYLLRKLNAHENWSWVGGDSLILINSSLLNIKYRLPICGLQFCLFFIQFSSTQWGHHFDFISTEWHNVQELWFVTSESESESCVRQIETSNSKKIHSIRGDAFKQF